MPTELEEVEVTDLNDGVPEKVTYSLWDQDVRAREMYYEATGNCDYDVISNSARAYWREIAKEDLLNIQSQLRPRDNRFRHKVATVLQDIQDLLVAKNEAYGNSALDPVNIFSKSTAVEQIKVRIDDKLSRLYHGKEYGDEDTITDLMGYLILLRIAEREADNDAK